MKSLLVAAVCAALLTPLTAGCFPKTAPPPAQLEVADQAENALLAEGHQVFIDDCKLCHGYPDLVHYPADRWPDLAKRMGAKAQLEQPQIDALLKFILAARAKLAGGSGG